MRKENERLRQGLLFHELMNKDVFEKVLEHLPAYGDIRYHIKYHVHCDGEDEEACQEFDKFFEDRHLDKPDLTEDNIHILQWLEIIKLLKEDPNKRISSDLFVREIVCELANELGGGDTIPSLDGLEFDEYATVRNII